MLMIYLVIFQIFESQIARLSTGPKHFVLEILRICGDINGAFQASSPKLQGAGPVPALFSWFDPGIDLGCQISLAVRPNLTSLLAI